MTTTTRIAWHFIDADWHTSERSAPRLLVQPGVPLTPDEAHWAALVILEAALAAKEQGK